MAGSSAEHAVPPSFPYPKWVWSPTGGWWPHPAAWKRNTLVVGLGLVLVNIPIYFFSEAREKVVYSTRKRDEQFANKQQH